MADEDEEHSKEVLTESKKDKEKPDEKKKAKEEKSEKVEKEHEPPVAPPPQYPPPQDYYQSPPQPIFTSENLPKLLGMALLIGIIILFVGSLLSAGGMYVTDDGDLRNTLMASGKLIVGIGLFITALFVVLPLLMIKDLQDKQKTLLILLMVAIIIGFTLLV